MPDDRLQRTRDAYPREHWAALELKRLQAAQEAERLWYVHLAERGPS